jgi:hypothetical protein
MKHAIVTSESQTIEIKKDISMQDALIAIVQRNDIDPDRLEKFLDLQIKMENRQAEKAFTEALSGFQGECPIITKKKKVSFGTTNYAFAPLDEIIFIIKPLLSKYGLSYSFDIKSEDKLAVMITTIYHKEGFSKTSFYAFDALGEGSMNQSQKRKSATTYAKRAGLENALGIVTAGEDDDANRAIDTQITPSQINEIEKLIIDTKSDLTKFKAVFQVKEISDFSSYEAKDAIHALKEKRSKGNSNV